VTNSTLSGNFTRTSGGGGISNDSGMLTLQNTIVAGNRGLFAVDINGDVDDSSGNNLIGLADDNLTGISNGVNNNQIGGTGHLINARLAPLDNYGGPTQTLALLPGSPALNAGDPNQAGSADQRGVMRSGGVNIGAFQASASSLTVSAPDTVTAGTAFDVTVSAFDVFDQPAVGYTGTITFSSADPAGATLPDDYTFTLADAGVHTFAGLSTLYTPGTWDVTATDLDNSLVGTTNVNVSGGNAPTGGTTPSGRRLGGLPLILTDPSDPALQGPGLPARLTALHRLSAAIQEGSDPLLDDA
jgi:hypothetical protein